MKFLSLTSLVSQSHTTFKRFPFVLFLAIFGTLVGIFYAGLSYDESKIYKITLNYVLFSSSLGALLLLGLSLFVESCPRLKKFHWPIQLVGLLIIIFYFYSLSSGSSEYENGFRFFVLSIGLHLFIAFAPFLGKDDVKGFWEYNKRIFIHILICLIYSLTIYAGLSIAVAIIDHLFDISIKGDFYFQLWIAVVGIFNTWFFLSGIPKNFDELKNNQIYPKGLKVFVQYVLVVLVIIYLVILYIYEIKIILSWSWPQGGVALSIACLAVVGILSYLLLYPIQSKPDHKWIQTFARVFFVSLIPLILLLWGAIWKRFVAYGITEPRYYVIVLSIWLGIITIYFIFSAKKNIKIIPISLSLIAIISAYGPWSSFNTSYKNQIFQFENLMNHYQLLKDGKITKSDQILSKEDKSQLTSIIYYLFETNRGEVFQKYLLIDMEELFKDIYHDRFYAHREKATHLIEYIDLKDDEVINYYLGNNFRGRMIKVEDYHYVSSMNVSYTCIETFSFSKNGKNYQLILNLKSKKIELWNQNKLIETLDLSSKIDQFIDKLNLPSSDQTYYTKKTMQVEFKMKLIKGKLIFKSLNFQQLSGVNKISSFEAQIFIK